MLTDDEIFHAARYVADRVGGAFLPTGFDSNGGQTMKLFARPTLLGKAELPLLDILGNRETGDDDLIRQRLSLMKHNAGYRIVRLTDTDHRLEGWSDMLINRIHGWLRQLPTKDAQPPAP